MKHPLLLVAGGIGITPLCAMLGHAVEQANLQASSSAQAGPNTLPRIVLLFSGRMCSSPG